MLRVLIVLALALLPLVTTAQDQPGDWLIGKWKGGHTPGVYENVTILTDEVALEFTSASETRSCGRVNGRCLPASRDSRMRPKE